MSERPRDADFDDDAGGEDYSGAEDYDADPEGPQECDLLDEDDDGVDVEPCPNCGRGVYEEAERCPYCGEWIETGAGRTLPRGPVIAGIAFLLILLLLLLIL